MADRKLQQPMQFEGSKIDALYSWLSYDLQRMKGELLKELKYASVQTGAFYRELQGDKDNSARAITQEIRFGYKQSQNIYEGLSKLLGEENARLGELDAKVASTEALLKKIDALLESLPACSNASVDVDAIVGGVTEKVVESIPYPEKVDYARISEIAEAAAEKAVCAMAEKFDYEKLAEMVAKKMAENSEQHYDVVLDEEGVDSLATKVVEKMPVDYDRIAEIVEDKLASEDDTYDLVVDQEGIDAIAKGVAQQLTCVCKPCEAAAEEEVVAEATVEEVVEATVEEVVEEVVESAAEETVEEVVEEEKVVSEADEIAAALALQEVDNQLVDAETGLVIRLKKSFTAKMRQSEERIKGYYSDIKNELTSYKRINSNVSWHGDRFNFGRDTVAKINILGKTLCFYLALDPTNPDFKTTVYHQKDVSAQKAYASTPFMVKVKSDGAAKKALRLVGILAEKIGAEKEAGFEAVDYVEEFAYESTKQLFDEGFIKATKEKKVNFDF